ncbi:MULTISPECIES: hypothetical protein [unclassified Rhizobium]|uniref:hypothetical protein n=1 Tax=unclassified Rhizobium TaxID=2613769 RepID=UPI0037F8567B
MHWRLVIFALLGIALFALSPILVTALASLVANAAGCELNEGQVHACIIVGRDYGDLLYQMGLFGWVMIFTIPVAEVALAIFGIALLAQFLWKILARKRSRLRASVMAAEPSGDKRKR